MIDELEHDGEEDFIFNEYAIDDTLDPLSRLLNYHSSGFSLQREFLLREIGDTVKFSGFDQSAKLIVPILTEFTSDCEPSVRQMLVGQLPEVAKFFVEQGGDAGYECLLSRFLPIGFELLIDKNVEVGASALTSLTELAELVKPDDVRDHLLNVVVMLAHDERAEEYRVVAARLFNGLAAIFGKNCCVKDVLPELELLANDSNFSVRKAVGENLGVISKVVEEDTAENVVLPIFLNLCKDEIWGVRKVCVSSIEGIALAVVPEARVSKLLPAYLLLLQDSSRWVRNGAHDSLGTFLHTLRPSDLSPGLLKLYTDMAFRSENGDTVYSEPCAFALPAVLQVAGRERWNEVADAYATLLKDVKWKVRRSLAYSLHEVALILGQEITESDLVAAFELLLRDLDEVRLGVVLHADVFLGVVGPTVRERLAPLLCHVPLESENWRVRNVVAQRIGDVGVLLDPVNSTVLNIIINLVVRLLDDSVMEVRRSTYRSAAILLQHLASAGGENSCGGYIQTLVQIADLHSFRERLMFPYIAEEVAKLGTPSLVEQYFLSGLLKLAKDEVGNVRLAVTAVMTRTFLVDPYWSTNPKILQVKDLLDEKNSSG
ncbi:serine/threonine-protein phosphatase 4 regulatory subunit 1 [Trypanosoma rangeli]|uniref:Serine/threonine-protein phosphatase 4 regulatory subunit 1 n=1 Tax=Trypanosoma rangeli TaxID=5698 RepID=A0A3R7KDP1_TRYRA|nr:serine/threonine-protein phosphatase 4 regulatory subunit 1 [Trypanosoma rangeli]RNE98448.1 serine/threonine-protein phosphatase 4 regulatory subunit 1 [Trypanosoma rangeli]|eukprot:RNE98448.1 serine/threonine-protein phosphatase 4 regulatory subunit 1 [Trypanosoma rangeli]